MDLLDQMLGEGDPEPRKDQNSIDFEALLAEESLGDVKQPKSRDYVIPPDFDLGSYSFEEELNRAFVALETKSKVISVQQVAEDL